MRVYAPGVRHRLSAIYFLVYGVWFMVYGFWFMVEGSWLRVEDLGDMD